MTPQASIVISTKDRKEELRRALRSVEAQSVDVEILVMDDGSSDGTAEMVAREFPAVRLHRSQVGRGYLPQRNQGMALASAPIVISLDDDAEFMGPDTVAQTLADFGHPRVAVVAIPYRNGSDGTVMQAAPASDGVFVLHGFVALGAAIRRDVFFAVGGYREALEAIGEEFDVSLRMLDRGFVTRAGRAAPPVVHQRSPIRPGGRAYLGPRNDLINASMTVPGPSLPLHLLRITAMALVRAMSRRRGRLLTLRGLADGYRYALRFRHDRQPVARQTFKLRQSLWRTGARPLEHVEPLLPPIERLPEARAETVELGRKH